MDKPKSVLIIGAGIGGIATAILLARKGFQVKVFEKNPWPGGRCGRIVRDGHRFDLGATIFLMPEIYRQVFTEMGLKLEECLELKPVSSLYKIHYDDGSVLDFTSDDERMEQQMEALEPGSYRKMQSFVKKGYRFMELSREQLLGRNFYRLFDFITLKNIGLLVKLKIHLTHEAFARRFFRHPHLRMAFTFQNIYVGQSPFSARALFSMLPAAEITEDALFPVGGMSRIPEKLEEVARELGVTFIYEKGVERILTDKNLARSVILEDGSEIGADVIVANADLPSVYSKLLPDRKAAARIDRLRYSCSAIVFHWGLDKTYEQLSLHNVFLSDSYRQCLDAIFKHRTLTERPCFYIQAPGKTDPSSVPEGGDTLSVLVPVPSVDPRKPTDWDLIRSRARTGVISRLKELGLTDIEDHINFEICYLPQTWEEKYSVARGATFGSLSHSIMQMGYFRPHNRHRRYRNLYFTGGSTHPGNGIPLVLLSAKLTSERIVSETVGKNSTR